MILDGRRPGHEARNIQEQAHWVQAYHSPLKKVFWVWPRAQLWLAAVGWLLANLV